MGKKLVIHGYNGKTLEIEQTTPTFMAGRVLDYVISIHGLRGAQKALIMISPAEFNLIAEKLSAMTAEGVPDDGSS